MRARLFALLASCTCAQHIDLGTDDAGPPPEGTLALHGTVCAPPADAVGFPLKVIAVVQNSTAMCVADPPGAQTSGTFCNMVPVPPGVTQPWRVRALKLLAAQLESQPSASLAIVSFDTRVNAGSFGPP